MGRVRAFKLLYPEQQIVMGRTITTVLAVALAVGLLAGVVGPVAAQQAVPEFVLQVDEFGPLLELIAELFDISISIEG